ncbi:DUF1028 domain-containing protein [Antarcticimicrobium sediminis]|uniref:DUF1028 domain-containing protein n=1 Tax=Antarcticimicrobium sediminis TaxID=2546227 RepID=A0A4R5EQ68_9RHOB|nr:DUF1028 domain-containing protein [Antarcticimicrobium sediminis]TDE36955.1 DUF1028 domain-containing protein [Antarcticimicrobium sediminis]
MTYSLIARIPETGEIGVAVASRFFACGAIVPHIGPRSAVATQAFVNPLWGTEGITRMEAGEAAEDVLADCIRRDAGQHIRQCHMMDAAGRFAAHTGADCVDWCGHIQGDTHSVAGNMLKNEAVLRATFDAFDASGDLPLADRLLFAMRAGEAMGGDKRGRQAAGLRIHQGEHYAHLDLRADDHGDPLSELERLLDVSRERYAHVARSFATSGNFCGATDRTPIDAGIQAEQDRRRAAGLLTRSLATEAVACAQPHPGSEAGGLDSRREDPTGCPSLSKPTVSEP